MSDQLVIESPQFDEIEKKAGRATRDAVNLLWTVLNQEVSLRRQTVRDAKQTLEVRALNSAPTTQQDNFDTDRATVYYFNSGSAFNLTGIRNGIEGALKLLHNIGSATVTIKHNSGSSDSGNVILTITAADKSLTTGKSLLLAYLNGKWREQSLI